MSEHSEHYHDTERNKPLPGTNVSSKEEVLQTLLTAARGEITALTEANKLLAAKVTEAESVIARLLVAAMNLHTAVNKHVAADDRTSLGVAFEEMDNAMAAAVGLEYSVVGAKAAQVAGSVGDDPQFKRKLATYWQTGSDESRAALIDHLDSRAAKVSARAADALDSQPTEAVALLCEVEGMQNIAETYASGAVVSDEFEALRDRISAFLSSQPTDGEVRNG